jgi:hypothetical protein
MQQIVSGLQDQHAISILLTPREGLSHLDYANIVVKSLKAHASLGMLIGTYDSIHPQHNLAFDVVRALPARLAHVKEAGGPFCNDLLVFQIHLQHNAEFAKAINIEVAREAWAWLYEGESG